MEKTVTQRVYEHVVQAGRMVSTRELLAVLEGCTPSSVTFALSRLVREGNLVRVAHGKYRAAEAKDRATPAEGQETLSWVLGDADLRDIFEKIRPVLEFSQLAFLYEVVGAARGFVTSVRQASHTATVRSLPQPNDQT